MATVGIRPGHQKLVRELMDEGFTREAAVLLANRPVSRIKTNGFKSAPTQR
jgi:hypothetical protein